MATRYWKGTAEAVAQITEAGINVFDAATTYGITIGDTTISLLGDTDEETTTDALFALLNASTNVYFSGITWDRNGATTTSTIRGTSDTAGLPFTFTTYANGGTGSWNAVSDTTANSGPNDWETAANWDGGVVPIAADDVVITDNAINICWGLDQNAITLDSLTIKKSYTGRIGLDYKKFATAADGATTTASKIEYRENYLKISSTVVTIGEKSGIDTETGSTRILLDTGSNASAITVQETAETSADAGRSAVRLLANHASSTIHVQDSLGGVGIAADDVGETSLVSEIKFFGSNSSSQINIGSGTTFTTYYQSAGTALMRAAATITTITMDGGVLNTYGDYTITTLTLNDGTVNQANDKTGGDAVTTLNLVGGTFSTRNSGATRTIATANITAGVFVGNEGVTITTCNEPSGRYTMTTLAQ